MDSDIVRPHAGPVAEEVGVYMGEGLEADGARAQDRVPVDGKLIAVPPCGTTDPPPGVQVEVFLRVVAEDGSRTKGSGVSMEASLRQRITRP